MKNVAKRANANNDGVPKGARAASRHLDFKTHLSFLIVSLSNKISSSASIAYKRQFGAGVMEWRVLAMVAAHPGVTAKIISQVSGVDKSSISRATHLLIGHGYLKATDDASDTRRTLHVLTPAGYKLHARIFAASMDRNRMLLTGFSESEHRQMIAFCHRLMANLPLLNGNRPAKRKLP
jgi:DNA-binding MarR family transcriptional regulator